jgi:hypothetical protein
MQMTRGPGERGTALLCVLMVTTVLATLSGALVLVAIAESMASANHGAAQQALYAAEAALEETRAELASADWRSVPGLGISESLNDAAQAPRAPHGAVLDLAALTSARQAESDAFFAPSADRPVWRLFGHGPFADLAPAGLTLPPAYLLVWVADDGGERDGDRGQDSNNVLVVRTEAYGVAGAHRAIEATLMLQTEPAGEGEGGVPVPLPGRRGVRIVSWKEVR